MRKYIQLKQREGVALLFALGILSLLLILGLAFVSNALLAQKVAFNNSSRAQAKMLAQSAIARAAAAIMLYQYQAEFPDNPSKKFWPDSFTSVYSGPDPDRPLPAGETKKEIQDQLVYYKNGAINKSNTNQYSKLNYREDTIDFLSKENLDKISWQLIYDKSKEIDSEDDAENGEVSEGRRHRKIIGRVAYRVLPPTSSSRLNLEKVLTGALDHYKLSGGVSQTRLGMDIKELNIEYAKTFLEAGKTTPTLGSLLDISDIPAYYDELYTAYGSNFFNGTDSDMRKDWVERWFSEGTKRNEFEMFAYKEGSGDAKLAYRFNLGNDGISDKTDPWYNRFFSKQEDAEAAEKNLYSITGDETKRPFNNTIAIDNLAEDAKEYTSKDQEFSKIIKDRTPATSGLPFLKSIANDKGTFDSIENRRKQIIANLNDYCDRDPIPTSNVPAQDWANTTSEILYTGNERTPYIYEVGLKGEFTHPSAPSGAGSSTEGIKVNNDRSFSFDLNLIPAVKLIKIYNNLHNNTADVLSNFAFRLNLENIKIGGSITKVSYNNYEYQVEDSATGTVETKTGTIPIEGIDITTDNIIFDGNWTGSTEIKSTDAGQEISISTGTPSFDENGYLFKEAPSKFFTCNYSSTTKIPVKITLADVKAKYPEATGVPTTQPATMEISVDNIKIEKFTFQFGRMVLLADNKHTFSDGSTDPVDPTVPRTIGLDYVKSQKTPIEKTGLNVTIGEYIDNYTNPSVPTKKISFKFAFGGMRGKDPRQNLNPGDWSTDDVVLAHYKSEKSWVGKSAENPDGYGVDNVMDLEISATTGKLIGKVNRGTDANPNGSIKDKETVNDPAWKDDTKHLSTAFIANRPMNSLWELGAIHRGAKWETINLKRASGPGSSNAVELEDHQSGKSWTAAGTSYDNGDGALLDEVKLDSEIRSYGKLDVNMLWKYDKTSDERKYDTDMIKALFTNLRLGQELSDTNNTGAKTLGTGEKQITESYAVDAAEEFKNDPASDDYPFESRAQFLHWGTGTPGGKNLGNGFGILAALASTGYSADTDAKEEEIIGKTINLLSASNRTLPSVVKVMIVAQTIRDVGGDDTEIPITRMSYDGKKAVTKNCKLGVFDIQDEPYGTDYPDEHSGKIYYDEITGEVKILATLDRNPETGQMMVRKIEYID